MAWDTEKHLKFQVPFVDLKPTIYFGLCVKFKIDYLLTLIFGNLFTDPFLPRVVELATRSTDRQTKVAACEFLHSLVLFMLGRGTVQPGTQQSSQYSTVVLYEKTFPALLKLSVDVEEVSTR